MSDWDAIFGEAAFGLDPVKVDLVPNARDKPHAHAGEPSAAPGPDRPVTQTARAPWSSMRLTGRAPAPTSDLNAIFRQEALEFRARGRDTSDAVVRLGARRIKWGYRITLLLLVAVLASIWLIRADESTSGPAVIDGRTGMVAVLLPAVTGPDLASSRGLTVTFPGGRSVRVSGLHARLADATAIRNAGLAPPAQPAILLTGRLPAGASAGLGTRDTNLRTQASVVLRTESLADVLTRQFNAMLGQGAGP